ncbi:MAG: cytoplasmic protein [Anaerolineaceae bacterium]|nr:MAG: cytoplasmic protein [Anaerolineaceae bacterium]
MKKRLIERENSDISYYQKLLNELYSDLNRGRTVEDIYGYLARTTGYLGKAIILGSPDHSKFVQPISWLLSLSTKLKVDLQDAFCRKYPGICPNCLEAPCVCAKTNKMPSRPIPAYKMSEELYFRFEAFRSTIKVVNLDQAVRNITEIYSVNELVWLYSGPWRHVVKIYEGASEIHEAISSYQKNEKPLNSVAAELADVLAWIVGAWGIIFPKTSLDDAFINYYLDGCPVCKSFPCKCDLHSSRPAGLVNYKQLATVREKIDELSKLLPDYQDDMAELSRSLDHVIQSQSDPTAKVVVSQTKDTIEKIKQTISSTDAENVSNESENEGQTITSVRYDVFLSYSTKDKVEAKKIETFLTKKNLRVFLSEKDIKPASNWKKDIQNALTNSKLLCVLATPNSLGSEWVITEWGAAWAMRIRILPILLRCSLKDLPERLKDYQSIDFHEMAKILDVLKE